MCGLRAMHQVYARIFVPDKNLLTIAWHLVAEGNFQKFAAELSKHEFIVFQ